MKQCAVSKGKVKASKVAKTSSVASTSGTRSRESIICTMGSDVEDSSDESEHKDNCSNSDIDVAVTDLSTDWTQDLSGFSLI